MMTDATFTTPSAEICADASVVALIDTLIPNVFSPVSVQWTRRTRAKRHDAKSALEILALQLAGQVPFSSPTTEAFALEIFEDSVKGRSVRTLESIPNGRYVCDYRGRLVMAGNNAIVALEKHYDGQPATASHYLFYFQFNGRSYCIDGTDNVPEWSGFARFINHSMRQPNLKPILVVDAVGLPHIVLFSRRDLQPGEELLFDYGERDKVAVSTFPWLKNA